MLTRNFESLRTNFFLTGFCVWRLSQWRCGLGGCWVLSLNPQMDLQAMDFCHRIGQTKPIQVYRLTTAQCIERRILKRAFSKLKLEHFVGQGQFKQERTKNDGMETSIELMTLTLMLVWPGHLILGNSSYSCVLTSMIHCNVVKQEENLLALLREEDSEIRWSRQISVMRIWRKS